MIDSWFAPNDEFALCRFLPKAAPATSRPLIGLWSEDAVLPLTQGLETDPSLSDLLNAEKPGAALRARLQKLAETGSLPISDVQLLTPVERQEIWGGGMTYHRPDINPQSPTLNLYEKLYHAERPFLFFKSQAYNVVGPGGIIRRRPDSRNTIAEPELAAFISANGRLVGYAIGSDVTARDIEQVNSLYLNQAKAYVGSCAIGPCVRLCSSESLKHSAIRTRVIRGSQTVFAGETTVAAVVRPPEDVAKWFVKGGLPRYGAAFITGNGVNFPADLTIEPGDSVIHEIDRLGRLETTVAGD